MEVDTAPSLAYGTGALRTIDLSTDLFPRASSVALNYKWFRLAKVEYEYRPKYNVFQEGSSAAGPSIPWLWTSRAREAPATAVDPMLGTSALPVFEEVGAVMRRFNRKITIRYKPNTLSATTYAANLRPPLQSQTTFSPVYNKWFPTQDPSNMTNSADINNIPLVTYYGHYDYVDQENKGTPAAVFELVRRCTWEFREPQVANIVSAE